ncbi:hypothetical protein FRACYDRAFT_267478 [Fragilariopsis cylindrus CCMP1102]|uniref:Uncharacterized protein n=1 Tax=Fragilariopsis cylindrus CCMP1102 TaxID=635003 RepID=A0A1E7FYF0_9STRA|nr:hypothetical protein FRACYDRAFT_267478 [Fragilariopsis cylindrus CCMP1102]|eukprot:OEU23179.1 hypothetical protein FRACYDRAFT_267478 [Fragilariopsis cylindrus CCMP1102]
MALHHPYTSNIFMAYLRFCNTFPTLKLNQLSTYMQKASCREFRNVIIYFSYVYLGPFNISDNSVHIDECLLFHIPFHFFSFLDTYYKPYTRVRLCCCRFSTYVTPNAKAPTTATTLPKYESIPTDCF